jgi:hypothetical protein
VSIILFAILAAAVIKLSESKDRRFAQDYPCICCQRRVRFVGDSWVHLASGTESLPPEMDRHAPHFAIPNLDCPGEGRP